SPERNRPGRDEGEGAEDRGCVRSCSTPPLPPQLELTVVVRLEAGLVHQLVVQRRPHGWSSSLSIHERRCSPRKITAARSQPIAASRASTNFAPSARNVAPATI